LRIALAAEGTRGDIYPMLTLASACAVRGHDVVFCAPPDFRDAATSRGLAFHAVGQDIRAFLTAEAAALHGGALAMARAADKLFRLNVERQFADLRAGAAGCDLLLAAGTQIAASSTAEHLGVPYRFIAYDPILLPSAEHPAIFLTSRRLPRWANRLSWWLQERLFALGMRHKVNLERARMGLEPVQNLYRLVLGERPILATEERIAPAPAEYAGIDSIGCLHPFEDGALPEKLEDFLAAGPPPVFVGFGSMTDPEPERTTATILDAVQRAGVRAVISEGWAGLGGVPLPSDVFVAGPVDHAALFRRVALIVHHGGAGTTTTAARAGKPQVIVPHVLDQFHWAHRMECLGVAPAGLRRRKLTAEGLAGRIHAAIGNEWLVDRARELGDQLRADRAQRAHLVDTIL
jgi:UDP:flavonoid glycosyltransferase YjiC (YdhE family)